MESRRNLTGYLSLDIEFAHRLLSTLTKKKKEVLVGTEALVEALNKLKLLAKSASEEFYRESQKLYAPVPRNL